MEKTVALISRKEGSTRAQFREYYETGHAVLGMKNFRFRKYLRNHVIAAPPDAGFDVFSEFWQDSVAEAYQIMAGATGDVMREDEARFMDRSVQRAARSHDRLIAGEARQIDPTPTRKQILLLKRGPEADQKSFADRAASWGAKLAESAGSGRVIRATIDIIEPFETVPFPCDAVLSFWLTPGTDGVVAADPPDGVSVATAATVESCETPPEVLAATYQGRAA